MDKLQFAHDWYMKHSENTSFMYADVKQAWLYADAMQAEAEKRKPCGLPDALRKEWQPDWGQAPDGFNWFFKQQDGSCHFSDGEPEFLGDAWATEAMVYTFESPISCPVDWEDSLRERPNGL